MCAADRFLILASDGVWEFLSNAEAVRIVCEQYDAGKGAHEACRYLIANAAMLWRRAEDGYRDDITATVIYLQPLVALLEAEAQAELEAAAAAEGPSGA